DRAMSPRPRTVSDADLLTAAGRAVSRVGPARLTLADVAAEAGVAPATLVQRFGSKRGLLLALVRMGGGAVAEEFAAIRAAHSSPLPPTGAGGECMAARAPTPENRATPPASLNMALPARASPRHALEHAHGFKAELQALLDAAVAAGELAPCDTARLARLV